MPFFLKNRNEQLTELMDQPDFNQQRLFKTYEQFTTINRLLSGWQRIYQKFIKPVLNDASKEYSILDIGCGGGDIIKLLNQLTKNDGLKVNFTGIDPDARAIQFSHQQKWPENISFIQASASEMSKKNESFDFVLSNHLVHHLTSSQLKKICNEAKTLAQRRIIFNDIERSDIGYASFKLAATPLFRNSFIVEDGLTSIKRSYRKKELQKVLPNGWQVHRQIPFRLLAVFDVRLK